MANINFNAKNFSKLELNDILMRNSQSFSLISKVGYDGTWYEGSTQGGLSYVEREGRDNITNELCYFSRGESRWYEDGESGADIEWEICRLIAEYQHHFKILLNDGVLTLFDGQTIITALPTTIWNRVKVSEVHGSDDQHIGDDVMIYELHYQGFDYQIELYNYDELLGNSTIGADFCVYEQLKYKGSGSINSAQSTVPKLKFMNTFVWKGLIVITVLAIGSFLTIFSVFETSKVQTSPCDITLGSKYLLQSYYNEHLGTKMCSGDGDTWQCYDYKEFEGMSFAVETKDDKDLIIKFMGAECGGDDSTIELPHSMLQYRTYYAQGKLYKITGNYRIFALVRDSRYWFILGWAGIVIVYFTVFYDD